MKPTNHLRKPRQQSEVDHPVADADKWQSFLGALAEACVKAENQDSSGGFAMQNSTRNSFEPPEIVLVPDLVLRLDREGNVLGAANRALAPGSLPPAVLAEQSEDLTREKRNDLFNDTIRQVMEKKRAISLEYSCTLANRRSRYEAKLVPSEQNEVIAVVRNITDRRRSESLIAGENQILEMIANGAPLKEVLTGLARLHESVFPGVLCSILLMDSDGLHLRHGAAPSLPETFTKAIDGSKIGPRAGSCGTAAYSKRRIIVTDIASDILWTDYRPLAAEHGLRSCWSTPILSSQGNVLGTFAVYYRQVTGPTEMELRLIETAAHIAGVAIERNYLEERFRESQKMEAFGQMAGGIAHDFNNILSVILGYTHLLLGDENLKGATKENLMQVCAAGERAARLARQLLTFSRKKEIELRPLDLNEAVRSIAKMLSQVIGGKVKLHCGYGHDLPKLNADEGMMEQMIINLALNGRDAMPDGGQLFIGTTLVSLDTADVAAHPDRRSGDFVCLRVRDAGQGMTPEVKARIFEPLFTTKTVGRGSGLGLAVVHGIVKQHHGWIEVDTQIGVGTTFQVFLPALRQPASSRGQKVKTPGAPGGNETILLVDDEPAMREMSKVILQRYGYRVLAVGSSTEALSEWAKHGSRIDLLLTVLITPQGPTGRELAKHLLARKPALKVIYSTGFATDGRGSTSRSRDAPSFLQKPYHPEKLASMVRQCLDDARK